MDVRDIRLYKQRWQAIEAVQQQELRRSNPEDHWRELNELWRRARALGMEIPADDEAFAVIARWARLKTNHVGHVSKQA